MERVKKITMISCLVLFLIITLLSPVKANFTDDGFGINSFGEETGFADFDELETPYFLHDTLKKLIVLTIFTFIALYVVIKKNQYRKILMLFSILILGFYVGGFLCPLSSVQNIILKYNTGFFLIFLVPTIIAIIWGRVFCGYICVFGAVQEFLHISRYEIKIPKRGIKVLQKGKYFLLFYLIIRILVTNNIILLDYTPFKSIFTFGGTTVSIIATITAALLSVFIYRPFCQFVCPLGAWLGLFAQLSRYEILPVDCSACDLCSSSCKLNAVSMSIIDKKECIVCGKCRSVCRK